MLKNVKESAINDERLAISEERLATVFLLTTDYTDYTVFFFFSKLLHILHSMATRSYARWPTDCTVSFLTQRRKESRRRFDSSLLLTPKITQTGLVMFIY